MSETCIDDVCTDLFKVIAMYAEDVKYKSCYCYRDSDDMIFTFEECNEYGHEDNCSGFEVFGNTKHEIFKILEDLHTVYRPSL